MSAGESAYRVAPFKIRVGMWSTLRRVGRSECRFRVVEDHLRHVLSHAVIVLVVVASSLLRLPWIVLMIG